MTAHRETTKPSGGADKLAQTVKGRLRWVPTMLSVRKGWIRGIGQLSCWMSAATMAIGCSAGGAETRRRLDDMEQQLLRAQNRSDRLEERVAALEAAQNQGSERLGSGERSKGPTGHGLPVVKLRPNAESPASSEGAPQGADPISPQAAESGPDREADPKKAEQSDDTDNDRPVIKLHGDSPQSRAGERAPTETMTGQQTSRNVAGLPASRSDVPLRTRVP